MASYGYPPPPPPPPPAAANRSAHHDRHGQRGGRGGRGGHMNRGGRRDGHVSALHSNHQQSYGSNSGTHHPSWNAAYPTYPPPGPHNYSSDPRYHHPPTIQPPSYPPASASTAYSYGVNPPAHSYPPQSSAAYPSTAQGPYPPPGAYTSPHQYPYSGYGYPPAPPPPPPVHQSIPPGAPGTDYTRRPIDSQKQDGGRPRQGDWHGSASFQGQKRKREPASSSVTEIRSGGTDATRSQKRNDRSKPAAPPAVPSFGFQGLPKKPELPSKPQNRTDHNEWNKTKKRKTNQLGMTPSTAPSQPENDEDFEDEEAAFRQSGQEPAINHNGQLVALKHRNEILAWIADRKRNFPTQDRIAARRAAEKNFEKQRASAKNESPKVTADESNSNAQQNSDDEAPEEKPIVKTSQTEKPAEVSDRSKTPCKYFLRDGYCRRRDCRFLHEGDRVERKPTLMERLAQEERAEQQQKALRMIKALGAMGFFDGTSPPPFPDKSQTS